MPRYRFAVKDEWGRRKTGKMDAPDLEDARKRLLQGGFEVLSLAEEGQPLSDEEAVVPRKAPPKSLVYVGVSLLVLAGMVALAGWMRRPLPRVAPPQPLKLVFSGRTKGACQRVMLDLPELPFHEEAILKDGRYRLEVELKVQHKPTYAWLQVAGATRAKALPLDAGSQESGSRKLLTLKPGQAEYVVDELNF
ncbi:hypothetical protein ABS71_19910 [bacterium SCN 62-11]|nr:hypothetical protein [Candidatus Eremiobacteraeota bacterium]ODT57475.1 MAG: hypothetical protein ABS71_19910 [bacterium SCN 62-11]